MSTATAPPPSDETFAVELCDDTRDASSPPPPQKRSKTATALPVELAESVRPEQWSTSAVRPSTSTSSSVTKVYWNNAAERTPRFQFQGSIPFGIEVPEGKSSVDDEIASPEKKNKVKVRVNLKPFHVPVLNVADGVASAQDGQGINFTVPAQEVIHNGLVVVPETCATPQAGIRSIDAAALQQAHINQSTWWPKNKQAAKGIMSVDDVAARQFKVYKEADDEKYRDKITVKIATQDLGGCVKKTKFWATRDDGTSFEEASIHDIKHGGGINATMIVWASGIWMSANNFG